jgi:hypothetical protein
VEHKTDKYCTGNLEEKQVFLNKKDRKRERVKRKCKNIKINGGRKL